jgi:hypothetical protein
MFNFILFNKMKDRIITRILSLTGAIITLGCLAGCKDMFVNPLKDKDTGESVTMLLIDRNFIKTKFYVHLVDYATGEDVTSEPIDIGFFGPDSVNLVSFTGEKKAYFTTSSAFIEVGCDPNVEISPANPIEFWVVAMSDNYSSVPQEFRYTIEGTKDLVIRLIKTGSGGPRLKVAFDEPFDVKFDGALRSPSLRFEMDINTWYGGGFNYNNFYQSQDTGNLAASNLKDSKKYSDYGFEVYARDGRNGVGIFRRGTPLVKDLQVGIGARIYTLVKRMGIEKCNSGLKIHVVGPEGGSGTFNYRIDYSDRSFTEGRISCEFPSDQLIEPISYPFADGYISVTLLGDAQYNMSNIVNLWTPCGETATFTATPKSNLGTYKFVTLYTCPDNLIGMALSIRSQFRKAGTSDVWTDFSFKGGVCQLYLESGLDYDFRVSINGKYYNYTLPTDPARIEAALRNGQNTDFKIKTLSVTTSGLTVTVNSEVEFSAAVCKLIK